MSEFARVLYELRIIGHGLQLQHKQHIKADNNVDEECEWGIENSLCDPQDKSGLNSIKCLQVKYSYSVESIAGHSFRAAKSGPQAHNSMNHSLHVCEGKFCFNM